MTNPDNIVRVRARNGGRASVYEANGWCQAFSTGLLEGNGVIQNTVADMNVLVGGSITKPDVVIATNSAGYKIALDIVGQQAVAITAPASNKRISAIVAYTDDLSLPTTQDTVTGAPGSCGLIVVNGTAASSPTAPNDTTIRSAITADGATGSQAAYCVIATILVENGTTAITSSEITTNKAGVTSQNIDFATIGLGEVFEAPLTVTLPNTAYNGNNVIMGTGSKRFSGGVYLLSIPTFCVAVSSPNYQATLSYRIDNGSWETIIDWAYWETGVLIGSIGAVVPVSINAGNHTVEIGVGTNSGEKRITVGSAQNIRSFLTKVGV